MEFLDDGLIMVEGAARRREDDGKAVQVGAARKVLPQTVHPVAQNLEQVLERRDAIAAVLDEQIGLLAMLALRLGRAAAAGVRAQALYQTVQALLELRRDAEALALLFDRLAELMEI